MSKILVPVDGSEHGVRALAWAARLALACGDQVSLLFVHDPGSAGVMGLAARSSDDVARIEQAHAAPAFDAALQAISEELRSVVAERLVVMGDPRDEITAQASSQNFEHIVIGSRGLSPISELLLGSVSEHVMRTAHCPVTVIR